jgi:phosphate transport system substrate-binding protein
MQKPWIIVAVILIALYSGNAASRENVIRIKGSDTLFVVAQAWAEAYDKIKPGVTVSVGGGGSGTGFAALLDGLADIANASRAVDLSELEHAQRLDIQLKEHVVGYDALAVYLHKDNPLKSLSFSQLARIFGRGATLGHWTDLGVEVPGCKGQKIIRVGRQNNSGTYVYFRSAILDSGSGFDLGILDMLSSKDVVHLVEKTPCAIGYSGLAYATDKVKLGCIAKDDSDSCVIPSIASASDRSYAIARPLFMYVKDSATPAVKDYLDWILSDAGQCVLLKKGYAPIRSVECH